MGEPGEGKVHHTQHVRGAANVPGAAHTSPGTRGAQGRVCPEHERRIPHREGSKGMGGMEFQGSGVPQIMAQTPHHPFQCKGSCAFCSQTGAAAPLVV